MKCQNLSSGKNKKTISVCFLLKILPSFLLKILPSMLRVNIIVNIPVNPCPAEPVYTLPLQTV